MDAAFLGHGDKGIVHSGGAKGGKDNNAKRDELQVLPSWVVEAGLSIVVGEGEVLDGGRAEGGETDKSQDEEHEYVDRQACGDRSA